MFKGIFIFSVAFCVLTNFIIIGFWNFNLQERQISNGFYLPRSRVLASISVIPVQNSNFLISFQQEFRSKSCLNHDLFINDTDKKGLLQAHTQGCYCYVQLRMLNQLPQQKKTLNSDKLSYGRRASFSLVLEKYFCQTPKKIIIKVDYGVLRTKVV